MGKRRMFSADIICSDAFVDMPMSAQALYMHLCMNADDDGFIGRPKQICRMVNANDDDLKILIVKRFILVFETGVAVIKHWLVQNLIRADMYKETTYKQEKNTLGLNEFGGYTELRDGVIPIQKIDEPTWLKRRRSHNKSSGVVPSAAQVRTENGTKSVENRHIGKVRLGKVSNKVTNVTLSNQGSTNTKNLTTMKDLLVKLMEELGHTSQSKPLPSRLRKLKVRLSTYSPAELLQAAQNIRSDDFMQGDNDSGKRFGTIDYLLRSDEVVDKWLTKDGPIDTKTNHQELLRNAHV